MKVLEVLMVERGTEGRGGGPSRAVCGMGGQAGRGGGGI